MKNTRSSMHIRRREDILGKDVDGLEYVRFCFIQPDISNLTIPNDMTHVGATSIASFSTSRLFSSILSLNPKEWSVSPPMRRKSLSARLFKQCHVSPATDTTIALYKSSNHTHTSLLRKHSRSLQCEYESTSSKRLRDHAVN